MADFNPPRLDPVSMAWNTVGSYSSYEEAQAAVDRLSDEGFPVENLDIVGSGLRLVERVTGRVTTAWVHRCALARSPWASSNRARCAGTGLSSPGGPGAARLASTRCSSGERCSSRNSTDPCTAGDWMTW